MIISSEVGRGDVLFQRGADRSIDVYTTVDLLDGSGPQGRDMRPWAAVFAMADQSGGTVYTQSCYGTSDGHMIADVPGGAFTGPDWATRLTGSWSMLGTDPDGVKTMLGHGYWYLED